MILRLLTPFVKSAIITTKADMNITEINMKTFQTKDNKSVEFDRIALLWSTNGYEVRAVVGRVNRRGEIDGNAKKISEMFSDPHNALNHALAYVPDSVEDLIQVN